MYTLIIIVAVVALIVVAVGYVAENSPHIDKDMGHPPECFMCNKGNCTGCPIDAEQRRKYGITR